MQAGLQTAIGRSPRQQNALKPLKGASWFAVGHSEQPAAASQNILKPLKGASALVASHIVPFRGRLFHGIGAVRAG